MSVHNADIAALFQRMADLLDIEGANPFRVRAYRRAAATIGELPESVASLIERGEPLETLPAIGDDLAEKIVEIVRTGRLKALEEVEARTPSTLAALTAIPGLGPKRVHALHQELGIRTLADLEAAAKAGRLRDLPKFGAAIEAKILDDIAKHRTTEKRFSIALAEEFARDLTRYLSAAPGATRVVVAGSYRRRRETVGDLDLLVICDDGPALTDYFVRYDEIAEVVSKGPTRSTVILTSGIQVDLRVVPEESYGTALHYFTGSKAHSIAIRTILQDKGLKLNEYGVFKGKERVGGESEEDVFRAAGLGYIEPELREDRGEIEASKAGMLPKLITLADIRGDLHAHTDASDGRSSLEEMAEAARALGYDYLAVSDHSQHVIVANGLDPERLARQLDEIDRLNDRFDGFRLLKSCEVDILADGTLDLPDSILKRLDYTVCAVHFGFDFDSDRQTERILKAMDNRYFNILAHPTGRLIGQRPGYGLDLDRIIEGARVRGCFLEINAHPMRLDLDDIRCRQAKEAGVRLAISTDAHSTVGLGAMRYGVDQARRGWIEAGDVLNTRPWKELKALFDR
ncbi:DNA polymerase/3'-5' exonuclease PolX [Hartmannibacter diazotrophicus]|uniref:DNA-directed DNA polymerase n=1 Tax=Hartmannibacter diazotrophicus TaxID=1482074 RepID=A0A2C9D846_9HYPH|nr:DNA polymerase/3'-5' exonuclease PolX [Hartmannibacter diazotrophicus]SON56350.1 DNA polymerase/3'-5' exonuclease PolX [Hartmannibacter diazotrophicus]